MERFCIGIAAMAVVIGVGYLAVTSGFPGQDETVSPSDGALGSDFYMRGSIEEAPMLTEGKTYYHMTEREVYVIAHARFSTNSGTRQIVGGDAYRIESADLPTFEILPSFTDTNEVGKDKNHVYYRGKIVEGATSATFKLGTSFTTCEYTDGTRCYNLSNP